MRFNFDPCQFLVRKEAGAGLAGEDRQAVVKHPQVLKVKASASFTPVPTADNVSSCTAALVSTVIC